MIELKNINKTYKSKKGKKTVALKDISLTFQQKGMTFILGKSGSGKSTLLNILGGLDQCDSGEMIIIGKSSKDFTIQDFDSYRNTYVGFIFQEFNLLEDYDVYENITLALQLQQKEKNEEKIDALLTKLGIEDLKNRKINELSGGQKQRVAIARALIKNPKIILADEPTGNLDSKTGKEVLELLKEIAKEKLVILVSHDEESAKIYADRIIEIQDGRISHDSMENKSFERNEKTYQVIKSKLPFKDSFKLGMGNLKHKKIRLFFTTLLIIFTLGFLSAADTLSTFQYDKAHIKMLEEQKEDFIEIANSKTYMLYGNKEKMDIPLQQEQEPEINQTLNMEGLSVYEFSSPECYERCYGEQIFHIGGSSYGYGSDGAIEIVETNAISEILKENIIGRPPSEKNEIVISNYLANKIIRNGIEVHELTINNEFEKSHQFKPKSYEEILNTNYTFYFGNKGKIKIVGIIDYDLSKLENDVISLGYTENILNKIFVPVDFTKYLDVEEISSLSEKYSYVIDFNPKNASEEGTYFYNIGILNKPIEYYDGSSWKKTDHLKEKEILINLRFLTVFDREYEKNLNNYLDSHFGDSEELKKKFVANYLTKQDVIGRKINLSVYYTGTETEVEKIEDFTIVGVYDTSYSSEENMENFNIYLDSKGVEEYVLVPFTKMALLYPLNENMNLKKVSQEYPYDNNLYLKTAYSRIMHAEAIDFKMFSKLAFYVSLVFLVFTVILISNFMLNSIQSIKKEIGILRALGASSKDITHIFLWEAFLISMLAGTLSSILLVVISNYLNELLLSYQLFISKPFLVGFRQFAVIYLLVFAITYLASMQSLLRISKMKPIDAILNK